MKFQLILQHQHALKKLNYEVTNNFIKVENVVMMESQLLKLYPDHEISKIYIEFALSPNKHPISITDLLLSIFFLNNS